MLAFGRVFEAVEERAVLGEIRCVSASSLRKSSDRSVSVQLSGTRNQRCRRSGVGKRLERLLRGWRKRRSMVKSC